MRDFTIDILWSKIQMAVAAIGGWLGSFLGGMDGLMIALLVFMALDYITGVMCAIADKRLSSSVGFKGICKKVLILMLVGLAHIVDVQERTMTHSTRVVKRELGYERFDFHSLRHTHATELSEAGVNIKEIQRRL